MTEELMKENPTAISPAQKLGAAVLAGQIGMDFKSLPEAFMYSMVCCSGVSYLD